MAITLINNGDTGAVARAAINAGLTQLNTLGPRGNAVPSYTGQIATNCYHATAVVPGSATYTTSQSIHIARDDMTSWQVAYPGCYGVSETSPGTVNYVKVAVEYPVGVITPVTFSGVRATTATGGADTPLSDAISVSIPRGAVFYMRVLANCVAGGVPLVQFNTSTPAMRAAFSTSALTDNVDSGTIGTLSNGYGLLPTLIIGTTTRPSVFECGDSIAYGTGSTTNPDQFSSSGILTPSIAPHFAFQKAAIAGDFITAFIAASTRRRARAAYCSVVICEFGNNDLFNGGAGAGNTMLANIASFVALWPAGKPIMVTTITPRTTSTDVWQTVANQTLDAQEPERKIYNRRLRGTGIPGVVGVIDICAWLESAPDSGKWGAAVDGVARVNDSTHPSELGYASHHRSGAVEPSRVWLAAQG